MRISDWSSDVCSSDLLLIPGIGIVDVRSDIRAVPRKGGGLALTGKARADVRRFDNGFLRGLAGGLPRLTSDLALGADGQLRLSGLKLDAPLLHLSANGYRRRNGTFHFERSEEHTSELQSLMRISYAVFCLKKKQITKTLYLTHHK